MIRGLYTSGWSMQAGSKKMDVISNNLANAGTVGFKRDTVVFAAFPEVLARRVNDIGQGINPHGILGNMELGSDVGEVFTYYGQGPLQKTDNKLDAAISGSSAAFFTVAVPDGNGGFDEYYTRDGSFALDANGQLVTKEGYAVLGENGPIFLGNGDFIIREDGTILKDGAYVDRLLIREFNDTRTLEKYGSNLVRRTDATNDVKFTGSVLQGYLEQSNVNIITEMVNMISVIRAYEANQKILQFQDATLDKAVNEVGAVR